MHSFILQRLSCECWPKHGTRTPDATNLSRSCWCFVWKKSCRRDRRAAWKSPRWGSCHCPFECSAFICLQVNVVTKLGIKLDLQIPQHLLYRWHLLLKASDFLLQSFLITEHRKSSYTSHCTLLTEGTSGFRKVCVFNCVLKQTHCESRSRKPGEDEKKLMWDIVIQCVLHTPHQSVQACAVGFVVWWSISTHKDKQRHPPVTEGGTRTSLKPHLADASPLYSLQSTDTQNIPRRWPDEDFRRSFVESCHLDKHDTLTQRPEPEPAWMCWLNLLTAHCSDQTLRTRI